MRICSMCPMAMLLCAEWLSKHCALTTGPRKRVQYGRIHGKRADTTVQQNVDVLGDLYLMACKIVFAPELMFDTVCEWIQSCASHTLSLKKKR